MNVTVSTDALELVAAVNEHWGLPTPHDASRREVFGDYGAPSGGGFLRYDPTTAGWDRLEEDTSIGLFACDWPIEDQLEVSMLIESLKPYRPSAYPDNRSQKASQPPFLYQGWTFAWVFVPELRRWELAPLGRH